ncbi:holo-ACP synthase [uncultured Clostridium sp.]|uniref:holo-ACP synthase n=1 Tax=uncultured Clostridium sp. TaxID=59620 RepID=UPI0025F576AB|nr:holo-ACP synthase [uncultured Clostridium sp.]
MIIGIGTDIIEIERIENAVKRTNGFLNKLFTENEMKIFESRGFRSEVIAGNFAAKEAVSKAVGTGFRDFGVKDIEILRDKLGKPLVNLSDKVYDVLGLSDVNIHISISHNRTNAIAYAVMEAAE